MDALTNLEPGAPPDTVGHSPIPPDQLMNSLINCLASLFRMFDISRFTLVPARLHDDPECKGQMMCLILGVPPLSGTVVS